MIRYRHMELRLRTMTMSIILILTFLLCSCVVYFSVVAFNEETEKHITETALKMKNHYLDAPSYHVWFDSISKAIKDHVRVFDSNGRLIYNSDVSVVLPEISQGMINKFQAKRVSYVFNSLQEPYTNCKSLYLPIYQNGIMVNIVNISYLRFNEQVKALILRILLICIVIFIFVMIISDIAFKNIAKSLTIIRSQMRNITQEKKIDKEGLNQNDDVTILIDQYNTMIDQLNASYSELARSEREGAWREMAQQIAHEIKNPLTPMLLKIQLLQQMKREKKADWQNYLDRVLIDLIDQINLLNKIALEFSDFAKIKDGDIMEVTVSDIIRKLNLVYRGYPNLNLQIIDHCSDQTSFVTDSVHFMRVMINICNNAIQSIDNQTNKRLKIEVVCNDESITFSVTDNGTGIPQAQFEKIFEPTFTTKHGGTGLGLAISKKIVEQYGGKITFISKEKVGTTFFVTMPRSCSSCVID